MGLWECPMLKVPAVGGALYSWPGHIPRGTYVLTLGFLPFFSIITFLPTPWLTVWLGPDVLPLSFSSFLSSLPRFLLFFSLCLSALPTPLLPSY